MTLLKNLITFLLLELTITVTLSSPRGDSSNFSYDYPDYEKPDDEENPTCNATNCRIPDCSCFRSEPDNPLEQRPQFVMLTFDDAVTVANIHTYRQIASRKNERNGRNVQMTFFVCHEYNDYSLTNELQSQGHEIAIHSISHQSNTDIWRRASEDKWKREMAGMRFMLSTFSGIPQSEMVGIRAPFLQTSGDETFKMLQKEGFLYDSSMTTRRYMDPPIWPYTLDFGYQQDCQIEPCPRDTYKGVWEVPMIQYKQTSKEGDFYCSMVDACTPYPKTAEDTKEFLMRNFNRHYLTTKAPFPVFLHEAWLRDKERLSGYLQFLDEILQKQDVFAVSVRSVLEYMKNPVPAPLYYPRQPQKPSSCNQNVCSYKEPLRIMKSCASCSKYYPWVGTPLGKRPPVGILNAV